MKPNVCIYETAVFQITKDVHHYVRSGMVKTTSINFAQQAKRSASVGESAWKRLVSFIRYFPGH